MTTKVTVDAHAGWPVKVEAIDHGGDPQELGIVQPNEQRSFVVFDTRQLVITEMPKEASAG